MTKAHSNAKKSQLGRMVAEAIVDCYDESEEAVGLFTMIEDHLVLPFATEVLGVAVIVERIKLTPRGEITAVCRRGKLRQAVPILDLPLPTPAPEGTRWIEAYRHWSLGG